VSVGFAQVPQPSDTRSPPLKRAVLQASSRWCGRKELCSFISRVLCRHSSPRAQHTAHVCAVFFCAWLEMRTAVSTKHYRSPSHPGLSVELRNTRAWTGIPCLCPGQVCDSDSRRFPRHSLCHCSDSGQNSALCLLGTADLMLQCPDTSGRYHTPLSLRRYHTPTVSSERVKMPL